MLRDFLARASLVLNRITLGPPNTYICARLADRLGPYSLPCRVLDAVTRERGHCRKQLYRHRYGGK